MSSLGCEDIWDKFDDFLLTPPQSPPFKFDLIHDTGIDDTDHIDHIHIDHNALKHEQLGHHEASLNVSTIITELPSLINEPSLTSFDRLHAVDFDLRHDCMWSGMCNEDMNCIINDPGKPFIDTLNNSSIKVRPETPLLSTSPLTLTCCSFTELLSTCNSGTGMDVDADDEDEELGSCQMSVDSSSSGYVSSTDSLINDHSYGSPSCSPKRSSFKSQSLIYPSSFKMTTRSKSSVKITKRSSESKGTSLVIPSKPQVTLKFLKQQQQTTSPNKLKRLSADGTKKQCNRVLHGGRKLSVETSGRSSSQTSNTCSRQQQFHSRHGNEDITIDFVTKKSSSYNSSNSNCSGNVSSSSSNSSSSNGKSKLEFPQKRREHNDSEKKRRDHLRNSFQLVIDMIPKLKAQQKKPARITTLREACSYISSLHDKERYLEETKQAEHEKREQLLKRLTYLQKEIGN